MASGGIVSPVRPEPGDAANPVDDQGAYNGDELAAARDVWSRLQAVERVTVTVIVDNETDGLSSPCACCDPSLDSSSSTLYQSEFTAGVQRVAAGEWPSLDFSRSLLAGHGLSLLVAATTSDGDVVRALFDGGPREDLWAGNAELLGVQLEGVGAAVLSHWHVDHSVGLLAVAKVASATRTDTGTRRNPLGVPDPTEGGSMAGLAPAPAATLAASAAASRAVEPASSQPTSQPTFRPEAEPQDQPGPEPFVFDLHPERPLRRGLLVGAAGKAIPFNEDPTWDELALPGCLLDVQSGPHTLLRDCFFVSGAIPRVTSFETGQPGHATLGSDGTWRLDPFIMEERYLAVRLRGKGAVVFSGCSHAGIVNVVTHVKDVSQGPVFGVMGGLHLASRPMESRIPETVEALRLLDPQLVVAGHCTGWRAKAALAAAFPGRFQPCSVGGTPSWRHQGGLRRTGRRCKRRRNEGQPGDSMGRLDAVESMEESGGHRGEAHRCRMSGGAGLTAGKRGKAGSAGSVAHGRNRRGGVRR